MFCLLLLPTIVIITPFNPNSMVFYTQHKNLRFLSRSVYIGSVETCLLNHFSGQAYIMASIAKETLRIFISIEISNFPV